MNLDKISKTIGIVGVIFAVIVVVGFSLLILLGS
jgi:hypothetical protein|tara:strand:- start:850 stop:951 length:102 start_codon:yes stop_codon:yes gene_type:complete